MVFGASKDLSSQSRNLHSVLPPVVFTEVTEQAGITFVHENGAVGDKWYPEIFGGGVVVLDVDSDGWSDLLFINSGDWSQGNVPSRHGLYRNNRDGSLLMSSLAVDLTAQIFMALVAPLQIMTTMGETTCSSRQRMGGAYFITQGTTDLWTLRNRLVSRTLTFRSARRGLTMTLMGWQTSSLETMWNGLPSWRFGVPSRMSEATVGPMLMLRFRLFCIGMLGTEFSKMLPIWLG
jgi:hypothetical protein